MMLRALPCLLGLLALSTGFANAQRPSDRLAFLAGCWEMAQGATVVHEMWLPPAGGLLLGVSRTIRDDAAVEHETMRIRELGDTLIFHAQPSGQPAAEFRALAGTDRAVTFENPAHDFPQRIRYRAVGSDSLLARVEGTRNGAVHGLDFTYRRIACTGR